MTFRKRTKAKFKLSLRKFGMLCKKPSTPSKRIRISKTIYPDGEVVKHDRIYKVPENKHSFESELHVWKEIHKETVKTGKNK
jgi:hypothetical protein